jgi:hypothetical protein
MLAGIRVISGESLQPSASGSCAGDGVAMASNISGRIESSFRITVPSWSFIFY